MYNFLNLAKGVEEKIVEDRRHLHQIPEVGFDTPETAEYVKKQLLEMGVEPDDCSGPVPEDVRQKYVKAGFPDMENFTGVVATIGKGEPCILLRADMDALPMEETSGLPFASKKKAAHTCGHDTHSAMLLGAARILKTMEKDLKGTVKLMFQPGEELGYGAKLMVDAGLMENPKVDAAMAIHIMSDKESGTVEYTKGIMSAAMDTYMLTIRGKGGHSSMPHQAIDPNMIMSQLYTNLNLLPGREVDPRERVALTIGKASGGTAANIIPDTAQMQIGIRSFALDVQKHMEKRVPEMIEHIVKAWRGDYSYERFNTPSTFTDADLVDNVLPFIKDVVGDEKVVEASGPMGGSEDFGYVTKEVPGVFFILGAGSEGAYPMHNPNMVLDESALAKGAAMYASVAMNWLESKNK